jgi:hypothetical protein
MAVKGFPPPSDDRRVKQVRAVACAAVVTAVLAGCGGSGSEPASTPDTPPNTGLPVAGRAQDVVNQANDRTAQLDQQTGSSLP